MSQIKQKSILVIDDDAMNREVMEAFLTSENYSVILARNGEQGLELAFEMRPDVIILDVRMPDISGYEVCEQLKNTEITQQIPVMIVTGFDSKEDFARGQTVGANDFITRPFDGDDLLNRVKNLLSN